MDSLINPLIPKLLNPSSAEPISSKAQERKDVWNI